MRWRPELAGASPRVEGTVEMAMAALLAAGSACLVGDLGTDFHSSSCLKGRVTASPQGTSRKLRGQIGGGCGTSWGLDSLC